MTSKELTKPLSNALAQTDIVDLMCHICHMTTNEKLETLKKRVEEAQHKGEDISNLMKGNRPMVLYLIQENQLESIKILADLGLNLHATDSRNNNALHYCAQKKQ